MKQLKQYIRKAILVISILLVQLFWLKQIAYAAHCFASPKQAYLYLLEKDKLTKEPPINLNTASAGELATLEGVGIKTAQNIVLYRQTMGRFKRVEDLMLIKGIGEKTVAKNRHRLIVTDD